MESQPETRSITLLIDHNIEGQAMLLWRLLSTEGWCDLLGLRFVFFAQAALPINSSDREVWRFAQRQQMILLTANRRMEEADSLEQTLREENTPMSLPVLTIANVRRTSERAYLDRCGARLLDIVMEIKKYIGIGRLFIP